MNLPFLIELLRLTDDKKIYQVVVRNDGNIFDDPNGNPLEKTFVVSCNELKSFVTQSKEVQP